LKIVGPEADNAEVLAWLERALEHTRYQRQSRLEDLLKIVRADILFEMRLTLGALDGKPLSDGEIG
jgi:hypothetical protein